MRKFEIAKSQRQRRKIGANLIIVMRKFFGGLRAVELGVRVIRGKRRKT